MGFILKIIFLYFFFYILIKILSIFFHILKANNLKQSQFSKQYAHQKKTHSEGKKIIDAEYEEIE